MLNFFVDLDDGGSSFLDEVGIECVDLAHARHEAVGLLNQVARDQLAPGTDRMFKTTVRDAGGVTVFVATLEFRCMPTPNASE